MRPGIFDIAVIGLGPAGARAAAVAAREGAREIAIDRKREAGLPVQCAEFVPALLGGALRGFSKSRVQRIDAMVTFIDGASADFSADFRGDMIDRAEFDAQLCEDAAAAGAQCRFGLRVEGVDADGALRLSSGETIGAGVVIGADGPRSAVGRAIGSVNLSVAETRQATVRLLEPHHATDIYLSNGTPGGYGWLFPKGDFANVGVGVAREHKSALKSALDMLLARLSSEGRISCAGASMTGGPIPVGGLLRAFGRINGAEIVLAGDAAGLANPVTGAGIAAAVMSGELAGEAALAAVAGDADAGADYQDELESLFGASLARARRHRNRLAARLARSGALDGDEMRGGWIAYPQYWAEAGRAPA